MSHAKTIRLTILNLRKLEKSKSLYVTSESGVKYSLTLRPTTELEQLRDENQKLRALLRGRHTRKTYRNCPKCGREFNKLKKHLRYCKGVPVK